MITTDIAIEAFCFACTGTGFCGKECPRLAAFIEYIKTFSH